MFSLEGKTILITGASSGIGRETSIQISKTGAKIIISGRNENRLNETYSQLHGTGHLKIQSDLTQYDHIQQLTEQIPTIDGMVYCAGITAYYPTRMLREEFLKEVFSINFEAAVLLTSSLQKSKKLNAMASLVYISSVASRLPYFGGSLYSSSKAALEGYVRTLALEIAPQKIRANCISPSFVETEMISDVEKIISNDVLEKMRSIHPLGFGKPTDIANASIFLLSDESGWITGINLPMGGV